ncbi:hypothetical protein [Actinosynnema sp. NPDC023587]|uniref:hypothetical protein n=1 Tax=Actinosynnema sp. NPDC023587 TaxID=3154695 RepID=UPI0033C75A19
MVTSDRLPRRVVDFATGALAAAVAVIALVGCSTAPVPTSDQGTSDRTTSGLDAGGLDAADLGAALARVPADLSTVHGLDLPLNRTLLTPVEELEVIAARNRLIERCLADHGITFAFPVVDPVRDASRSRRHGLVDAAEAAAYGYRDPAVFAPRATGAEATAHQPSPDVVSVITGTRKGDVGGRAVPAGGCAGEADRALAADGQPGQEQTSFALSRRSHQVTRATPPVTEAAGVWSRCMARAGFDYDNPDVPIADPAFSAGRPSAHEIAVATQDVRCKEQAQWVRTWVGVERAVQDVLISRHGAELDREQRHKVQQLAVAREVNG